MSLSIIIPTISRPSLRETLYSVYRQYLPEDQIIVVGDGSQPLAKEICQEFKYCNLWFIETLPTKCWGHAQRNFGQSYATKTHLTFMDDDDKYAPGALNIIRKEIALFPKCPIIFRMSYPNKFILWVNTEVRMGNVGTPMIVVPNDPTKLGVWGSRREGDFDFLNTMKWNKKDIMWSPEIIALIGYNDGESK